MNLKYNRVAWNSKDWGKFIEDVRNLVPLEKIAELYGFKDASSVQKRIGTLRRSGVDFGNFKNKKVIIEESFAEIWNSKVSNTELKKKFNIHSREDAIKRAEHMRKLGYEMRVRKWTPKKERIPYIPDGEKPVEKYKDVSELDDKLKQSVIMSHIKGAPEYVNAELHETNRYVIHGIILDYKKKVLEINRKKA